MIIIIDFEPICMFSPRRPYGFLAILSLVILVLLISSCQSQVSEEELSSPQGYDLNKPSTIKLPGYLDEISGLAYYEKDKSAFAINDEKGWLYKIFLSDKMPIQRWKYAAGEDFEDLVLYDSTFYVLQSNGVILGIRFTGVVDSVEVTKYDAALPGKNEFEILYLDTVSKRLVMLCKDCEVDDKNRLTSYAFDLQTKKFLQKPAYVIDVRKIEAIMQEKKVKFKPSAAAIHPLTGKLFIVSSINKVVVVANREGVPEKVHRINPKLYKQPEGLAFSPEGHLLISNESADIGAANIFIFKYNPGQ
jgi:hypothetical protein